MNIDYILMAHGIGGAVPNLTLTELILGNYKIVFNQAENSLDFEVIE